MAKNPFTIDKSKTSAIPFGGDTSQPNTLVPKQTGYASPEFIEAESTARRNKLLAHKQKAPAPEQHTLPESSGPPVAVMQFYNVWMPIREVNKKVSQITDAHTRVTGVPPSPGLVRDILVADPVITRAAVSYSDMFSRSNTPIKAMRGLTYQNQLNYAKYLGQHGFGHEIGFPGVDEEDWDVPGLYNTTAPPGSLLYKQIEANNIFMVAKSKSHQEGLAGLFGGDLGFLNLGFVEDFLLHKAPVLSTVTDVFGAAEETGATAAALAPVQATGLYQTVAPVLDRPVRDVVRGWNQVRLSFLDLPQGVVLTANAVGLDAWDVSGNAMKVITGEEKLSSLIPQRTFGIVESGALQIKEDILNPEERLGYLALDVFGTASVGAGTAIRIGTAIERGGLVARAAEAGDLAPVARGQVPIYRAAEAETVPLGELEGHIYYRTPQEAREAAGEGADLVRAEVPAQQLTAYAQATPLQTPDIIMSTALKVKPVVPPGPIRTTAKVTGAAAKGLLSRPVGGSGVYGFGSMEVTVPYFDNALARQVQKGYLKLTLGRLERRQLQGEYIFGNTFLDHLFAPERKVRSLLDTRDETSVAMQLAPVLALQRYKRWDSVGKGILKDLFTQPRALSSFVALHELEQIALDKAILLLATDSSTPITDWRVFHQNRISEAEQALGNIEEAGPRKNESAASFQNRKDIQSYKIGAHRANLEAIDEAVRLIANPTEQFEKVYAQSIRVAKLRDEIQRTTAGMDDRTMDQSTAQVVYQLQGIETLFDPSVGRFVYPRGSEAWVEAQQLVESRQAGVNELNERLRTAQANAGSRKRGPTQRDQARIQQIQDELVTANEALEEAARAQAALGEAPEKQPLTRILATEAEQVGRAVRHLQLAMEVTPNLEIQRAITFLQQGEHPANVAAYLGQVLDRWGDPEALLLEDPAWGSIHAIEQAIDELGGVPIDNVLYGRPAERFTPGGQLVQEFRDLERIIQERLQQGVDPTTLEVWPQWERINERLGLDPLAQGSLLPEDPAAFAAYMQQAGGFMVQSERQAQYVLQDAQENLRLIGLREDEYSPQARLARFRYLEARALEIEARAADQHGEPEVGIDGYIHVDPEDPFSPTIQVGTPEWEEWARDYGFTDDDIVALRAFFEERDSLNLSPFGYFEGTLQDPFGLSDQEILEAAVSYNPEFWGGMPIGDARRYEQWRVEEAEAFLAGDISGAQAAKAEQIAMDERLFADESTLPPLSSISTDELRQRARDATVTPEEAAAQEQLGGMRAEAGAGSFHVPQRREIYREDQPRMRRMFHRLTNNGFLPPKSPDSHRHRTGRAIDEGDARLDTSNLLMEQYGDVLRIGAHMQLHRTLFENAIDIDADPDKFNVLTKRHRPIRDIRDAPKALQEYVQALQRLNNIHPEDLKRLREQLDQLSAFLYPDESQVAQIAAEGGHVRWIDERFITQKPMGLDVNVWRNIDSGVGMLLGPVNEMWRLMLLFSSPAYALNAVGSSMLLLTKQGFLAPVNLGRAVASRHIYGEEVTRILDAMAGNTHTMSYLPDTEKNLFTAMSRAVTNAWQYLTDTHFRRAAVIHELRRRGLLKDNLSPTEMADQLLSADPEIQRIVTEATHASRNGMLNFNRMSWPERAIARHLFFIYSFMRASAAYSLHYLFEHPAQHAALSAVGREREDLIKKLIGDNLPEWFYNQGWIPIGPGEVINPSQMNMAGILNQLSDPLYGMFQHTAYGDSTGFAQGGVLAFTELITGRSLETGQKFDRGAAMGTAIDLWAKTPLGRVFEREKKEQEPQQAPPISVLAASSNPIEAAMASERAALGMSSFQVDGWWDTWGRFLGRSAVPQHPNVAAMQARHWRDIRHSDPEAYAQHEREMVQQMVTAQEAVLGKQAPEEVRAAVDFVSQYVQHMNNWREGKVKGHQPPKDPNARMEAAESLRWMKEQGLIDDKAYRVRMGNVRNPALSETEVNKERIGAMWDIAGKPWFEWNDQVRQVEFFAHGDYPVVVQRLDRDGLGNFGSSVTATEEQQRQYGRQALNYSRQLQKLRLEASGLDGDAQTAAMDKVRAFEDRYDRPVEVDGVEFPPLSLAGDRDSSYARQTEPERRQWLLSRQLRSWGSLSNFEKRVLTGERRDPIVSLAWRTLHQWIANDREALQPGKKLTPGLTKYYGDSLASQSSEFKADWDQAQAPLAQRMLGYQSIQRSDYAEEWDSMLTNVASWANSAYTQGWKPGPLGAMWKRDMVPQLEAWISRQDTGFRAEVQTYVEANPNFLTRLVKS